MRAYRCGNGICRREVEVKLSNGLGKIVFFI